MTGKNLPIEAGTESLLSARLEALGLELCHADWNPGRGRATLTLFIDRPGGVTLEDCEAASREASEVLDPLEESLPEYVLEVSSPGLDRPLWKLADCEKFKGRRVAVRLERKVDGAAKLKGILEDVREDSLTVLDEDQKRRYTVRFGDVRIARLVPEL
ncbi:MAG: ribosome maturation factor RimP [Acidobacteria bacterium]|nr:ribosome maturation factor RimP [Acidobacteriota bacterium]